MKRLIAISLIVILISAQAVAMVELNINQSISNIENPNVFFESLIYDDISQIMNLKKEDINSTDPFLYLSKTINIPVNDLSTQLNNENQHTLILSDSVPYNQPGLPLIPMKKIMVSLPKNAIVHDLVLNDHSIQKCNKELTFQITPKPLFWSVNETPMHNISSEIIENNINDALKNELYPGKLFSSTIGKNSTNTTAIIHLFPIQYNLNTKETFVVANGTISIFYQLDTENETSPLDNTNSFENLIITPPLFKRQAEKLKEFHDKRGTPTEIVTTTWIKTNFKKSEYPPILGYANFSFRDRIQKYDDVLARKIISYISSLSTNTHLQFITLLGNAIHVPASYYFGDVDYPVPTDFYYSSPDLDLIPNYCVGRLPVNSILEASKVIDKILNWNPTSNQMSNVAIAGGIPFNSEFFIGELITIDSVNRGIFDGFSIDKFYRTEERFEKEDITSLLQNDFGLLYMICHGNTNLIAVEEGRISAKDLIRMPENSNAPIISCIACSSGSYDTHVIKQGYSLDKTSFGEGVLLSKGAGIAYIGGSRTNDGYPIFTLDHGRVEISKETYMAGLLTYVNQAYTNNYDHLGELTKYAAETYLTKNDMSEYFNLYHYFSFVLLGDPALILPSRNPQNPSYILPETVPTDILGYQPYNSEYDDYSGSIGLGAIDEEIVYDSYTDSPGIEVKKIETGDYLNLEVFTSTHSTQNGKASIPLKIDTLDLTLLRFESNDGKEDWQYIRPIRPVDDDYNLLTPGLNETRWNRIQDAINQVNLKDPIYVFNGTYNEQIIIDKPCIITGEDRFSTIIDGEGYDNVITIYSDDVILSDLTIEHCGKNPWNSAISIQPRKTWNPKSIIIQDNRIQNNKNCGIYIDNPNQYRSPTISLLSNNIAYNNFGIFINSGVKENYLIGNNIYGNNYGLYVVYSQDDIINSNNFENNGIGLFFKDIEDTKLFFNNFIQNTQHCQFTEPKNIVFSSNYWDNWIGNLFKRDIRIPKIINGIHDPEQTFLSQLEIDRGPSKTPYV